MPTANVDVQSIPACLRGLPQWVCWRYEERDGRETKCPYDAWNPGHRASSTDPTTWTTVEDAIEAASGYDGIGFVFSPDDPFCGIDLDDCLNEAGRQIWGADFVPWLDTYTEISPSGRGLKLVLRGRKPSGARCSRRNVEGQGKVEVYDSGRFFTITGQRWTGTPPDILERQQQLDELCDFLWPTKSEVAPNPFSLLPMEDRVERCLTAVRRIRIADQNDGSKRLYTLCCRCVEHDLTDDEALTVVRACAAEQPFPVAWSDADVLKRLRDAEQECQRGKANVLDLSSFLPAVDSGRDSSLGTPAPPTVRELVRNHPVLREPIVRGLLRRGESMNVIAAPKTGKSWLASDLAIAVATGRPWFGRFETEPESVLIVDNELHAETSASRIPRVAEARGIPSEDYDERVCVENLRGRLRDLYGMSAYFDALEPGRFGLILLDAFYRFLPRDTDENDNGAMAGLYNLVDRHADRLGCSFVLIHHSSKGSQSGKSVTDVGAGAGSQSRAVDTHLVLRPHDEPGVVVLEAAVRSWSPPDPLCLRWSFPVWLPDDTLDPRELKVEYGGWRGRRERAEGQARKEPEWTPERFIEAFLAAEPKPKIAIVDAAIEGGLSERRATSLLSRSESRGLVHRHALPGNRAAFATTAPDENGSSRSKRFRIEEELRADPDASNREIARRCDVSHGYVSQVRAGLGEPEVVAGVVTQVVTGGGHSPTNPETRLDDATPNVA